MSKIILKRGLSISKEKITVLQEENMRQVKGGRGMMLSRAKTKGPNCSCTSYSCNTNEKTIHSSFQLE
jgi:hypothetical protein